LISTLFTANVKIISIQTKFTIANKIMQITLGNWSATDKLQSQLCH